MAMRRHAQSFLSGTCMAYNNVLDYASTPTNILDDLFGLGYRGEGEGGDEDMPSQSYSLTETENEFASFSAPPSICLSAQQPLSQLQGGLRDAEKQFQEEVESDPFLKLFQTQRVKTDPSGSHSMETQLHGQSQDGGDFRGTVTGQVGCEESKHGDEADILSSFSSQPLEPSGIFPSAERGSLQSFPENNELKGLKSQAFSGREGFHSHSLFTSAGQRPFVAAGPLETDSAAVRCVSAPGGYHSMSKPVESYVVPPRPASVDSNLSASAMVVDDPTTTRFPFNVASRFDPLSSDTTHAHFHSNASYTHEQDEVQSACVAVRENQREAIHQSPQMQSCQQPPRYGLSPSLRVINQPQQEQTVLYESDSATRGVLKDREGKGFPAVMVTDYEGPAEIYVYAATSTGEAHPFFFVQCVDGVGHCHCDKDQDGLRFVRTNVHQGNGMRAIFPKLSVKRYKEKEVKHNFAQWQHEKSFVFLRFLARLPNGETLDEMSEKLFMTRKADMQKRRDQMKSHTTIEPTTTTTVQAPVSQPLVARIIGSPATHEGGTEICIYGSNFSPDCHVVFSFPSQFSKHPVEARKLTDQMACTNTHLLVHVPPSPLAGCPPPYRQQRVAAKVYVINPMTCSQSADSMHNVFIYSD